LSQLSWSKKLLQHGSVARILELIIQVIADEIEGGLKVGVGGVLGELRAGIFEAG
jgi:hypothetical protein